MVQELCQHPVSQHLQTINASWNTAWHTQMPLMHLKRAKRLCCALVEWVIARGRLGISQDPSDRLLA